MASGRDEQKGTVFNNQNMVNKGALVMGGTGSATQTNQILQAEDERVKEAEKPRNITAEGLGIDLISDWSLSKMFPCLPGFRESLKKENIYPMTANPCGHVLMINVHQVGSGPKRIGASADRVAIEGLFKQLNFEVGDYLYDDNKLTAKDIKKKVGGFFSSNIHKRCDAAVMALLSHGGTEKGGRGFIQGTDGLKVYLDELFSEMADCEDLEGKPKIVLIQACRGEVKEDGLTDSITFNKTPDSPDHTIYIYGSLEGKPSYRNPNRSGSVMIQLFCEVLTKYGATQDMLTLLEQLDKDVKNKKIPYDGDFLQLEVDIRYNLSKDKKLYLLPK